MKSESRQARWEAGTRVPLLVLSAGFGVAYAVPVVAPDARPWVHTVCGLVEWTVWAAFAVDYLVRLTLAPARLVFVRRHPLDLLAVLLPLVQPLRLLRLVATMLLIGRRARTAPQITLTTYVAGAVVGLLMFGSLAVLQVERDAPGGNIRTLGDAVWWSFTTMTTVGYGDHAPTTGLGRLLAVGLMLSGIALLGVVTANIAAWFISRFDRDDEEDRRQRELLEALTREVRELRAEVGRLSAQPVAVPSQTAGRTAGPTAGQAGEPAGGPQNGGDHSANRLEDRPADHLTDHSTGRPARRPAGDPADRLAGGPTAATRSGEVAPGRRREPPA
ncbi:potassium channel family protein [Streptomyces sp. ODS05-4]|uniref:potassium channel family protein n=1 Tax=Streptomyces sp. ODS05-4 TaxID=2944939 RepID=UPI0035B02ABA